ncbi:MAG: hypothetical protein JW888_17740 [Pirellulales bacterium]|nr:hypothetical protein [Pirellulales bacterium]
MLRFARWFSRRSTAYGLAVLFALWGIWIFGQVFRDATQISELAFYFPSPVLLALLVGIAFWAWRGKRRGAAAFVLTLAVAPAVFVFGVENHFFAGAPAGSTGPTIRLVHWNVFHGAFGRTGVWKETLKEKADFYVISEPGDMDVDLLARQLGNDYSARRVAYMAIVARGRLQKPHWVAYGSGLVVYSVRWTFSNQQCNVFVVDLASDVLMPRDPRLRRLVRLIHQYQPDLVVGDFNAPRRSLALSSLPSGYAHAYDVAGSGWSYTWPFPVPVYAIDQCILGRRVVPARYRLVTSLYSDHRRQVLDFTMTEPDEAGKK